MNKNILKKTLIILGGIFAFIYILFLILPVLLIPVLDLLSQKTSDEIFKTTGFKAEFVKFRVVTTPKLTFGVKLDNAKIYEPTGDLLLDSSNLQVKASLIPLLAKKIELDLISADDINLNIKINPDGTIFIDKYFKKEETKQPSDNNSEFKMPFGFVLSNNLPDIKILKHNIKFIDIKTNKAYFLEGKETKVSDFVFNKKIKVETEGKIVLDNFEALDYEIKIFNRLMPDMNFNDAVFAGNLENENSTKKQENEFNILQFFKQIKDKKIKAELDVDLDISGNFEKPVLVGEISLDKISMLLNGKILPESKVDLTFEKEGLEIESDIYTKETENIKLTGLINHKKLNLNCVSNVGLENVFEIIKLCEEFPNVGIRISIEGLEETNNKIRGLEDGFNKGYSTLKKLVEMKHPDVGFGMTVQDANAKDLVALYEKSNELGMEFATASLHNSFYFVEAKNIIKDRMMVAKEFEKLVNRLLESNSPKKWFRAYFNHGLINYIFGQKRLLPCDMSFDTFFIDPYGDVMPCNGTKDKEVMGNLNEETWDELWNSEQAEKVRRKVRHCDRQCWMIGSVSPAMHKYIWVPAWWVIRHKFFRFFKKQKYLMFENKIVRDYRDGKVTKEELDRCSTCDMHAKINNGLSEASMEQLKDKTGEEIVDADIANQMKK